MFQDVKYIPVEPDNLPDEWSGHTAPRGSSAENQPPYHKASSSHSSLSGNFRIKYWIKNSPLFQHQISSISNQFNISQWDALSQAPSTRVATQECRHESPAIRAPSWVEDWPGQNMPQSQSHFLREWVPSLITVTPPFTPSSTKLHTSYTVSPELAGQQEFTECLLCASTQRDF